MLTDKLNLLLTYTLQHSINNIFTRIYLTTYVDFSCSIWTPSDSFCSVNWLTWHSMITSKSCSLNPGLFQNVFSCISSESEIYLELYTCHTIYWWQNVIIIMIVLSNFSGMYVILVHNLVHNLIDWLIDCGLM